MPSTNNGWDDCGHAQGRVEEASQRLVACAGPGEAHDKQPAAPLAQWTVAPLAQWTVAPLEPAGMERPPDAAGGGQPIPGPSASGSDSEAAAKAVEPRGGEPSRAPGRQRPPGLETAEAEAPPTAQARLAAHVQPPQGRAL